MGFNASSCNIEEADHKGTKDTKGNNNRWKQTGNGKRESREWRWLTLMPFLTMAS